MAYGAQSKRKEQTVADTPKYDVFVYLADAAEDDGYKYEYVTGSSSSMDNIVLACKMLYGERMVGVEVRPFKPDD
jgi:hypothetical protein